MVSQPRIVVAATRSGDGKTTVATGLMAALRAAGLRVSAHKVGPDYIDPGYHAAATGRPGRNLDPWLVGEERIAPLFLHGASGAADIAIVEGVMGLFDGAAGRGDFASTAHVARLLDAPIVLVVDRERRGPVDRRHRARFRHLRSRRADRRGRAQPGVFRPARADPAGGSWPTPGSRCSARCRPRRSCAPPHATSAWCRRRSATPRSGTGCRRCGELIAGHVDLERLTAIARSAPPLTALPWSAADHGGALGADGAPVRVAVAAGPAFTFGYAEHAELLAAAGAEVTEFDPITAGTLPVGTDALVVGGGFPELYAAELAANVGLRAEVSDRVAAGMPVIAECAGLLWLGRELDGSPQCGVLPAAAR